MDKESENIESLAEVLRQLERWKPHRVTVPSTSRCEEVAKKIVGREGRPLPPPIDIKLLFIRLERSASATDFETISATEWRYTADCLGMENATLLANNSLLNAYMEKILADKRAIKRLLRFYLTEYTEDNPQFDKIRFFLEERVQHFKIEPWANAKIGVNIFSKTAVVDIATYIMWQSKSVHPQESMHTLGFKGSLFFNALTEKAFLAAADIIRVKGRSLPDLFPLMERLIAWHKGTETFRAALPRNIAIADAFLCPWIDTPPDEEMKEFIVATLLELLRDPRIDEANWRRVKTQAREVILRWLTWKSLGQFFDIVERITTKQQQMWAPRRKFWFSYYERGYMTEAWVAFATAGQTFLASNKMRSAVPSGKLEGSVGSEHAVLLMRIGRFIVADWNANGKCHIWKSDNPSAPGLYKARYHRDEVRNNADMEKVHIGKWQDSIANYIDPWL